MPGKQLLLFILLLISSRTGAQQKLVALVAQHGYWKTIDTSGRSIADSINLYDPKYCGAAYYGFERFSEGILRRYCYRLDTPFYRCFINYKGEILASSGFNIEKSHNFKNSYAVVAGSRHWGAINSRGKLIVDTIYDYVSDATREGVFVVRKDEDIAVVDTGGKFIVPFFYKTADGLFPEPEFGDGLLRVMRHRIDSKEPGNHHLWNVGYINSSGKLVIDTIYKTDDVLRISNWYSEHFHFHLIGDYFKFSGGLCMVMVGYNPTVINTAGDSVFSTKNNGDNLKNSAGFFVFTSPPEKEIRYVGDPQTGVYNRKGKLIIPLETDEVILRWNEELLIVKKRGNCEVGIKKVYDTNGQYLFQFYSQYYDDCYAKENRTFENALKLKKPYFLYSKYFRRKNFDGYDRGYRSDRGKFIPLKKFTPGVISTTGKFIAEEKLGGSLVGNDGDNWAVFTTVVGKNHRFGYVDEQLEIALPVNYDGAQNFKFGLAAVKMNGKWGYINKQGRIIIPCQYDEAVPFQLVNE